MMNMGGGPTAPQMPGAPMPPAMPMMPPPQPVDPAKLFAAQELLKKPTWDDVIGLFRNDRLRSFTIDIETDSTIVADEQSDKQTVSEFFSNVGSFLGQMLPVVEATPELMPFAMEMLKYGARRFEAGRQMETVIDETADKLLAKASNPSAPAPDPKLIAAQGLAQAAVMKGQAQIQVEQQKMQASVALKGQEAQANMALRQSQAQADAALEATKAQTDAQIEAMKAMNTPVRPM